MTAQPRPTLKEILGVNAHEEYHKEKERQFERQIVMALLRRYGLMKRFRKSIRGSRRVSGVLLENFHAALPEFPIRLHARVFRDVVEDAPVHRLYNKIESIEFVRTFHSLKGEIAEGYGALGLIFPWPELDCQLSAFVLHNLRSSAKNWQMDGGGLSWIKNGETMHLEPLDQMLNRLDSIPLPQLATST